MKPIYRMLAGIAGAAMASAWDMPAQAITVATTADLTTSLAAGRFRGVGSLGSFSAGGQAGHGCTGSLLSANVVLTAAHCVGYTSGPLSPDIKLFLPAAGDYNLNGGGVFTVASALVLGSYSGVGVSDIALLTLTDRAFGYTTYDIYTDRDEIGQEITLVGAGMSGTMGDGASFAASDSRLRAGRNRYELTGSALGFGDAYKDDLLAMDNDSGLAENDVFGQFFGLSDLGVFENGRLAEAGLIYGDSGGPDFIGNKIAGVHSAGGSGMFLDPAVRGPTGCGLPGSVDPVKGSLGDCTDGSFGDFAVSVRTSYYAEAIRSYVAAAAVPEPGAWTMMIAGFGLTGIGLRRRGRAAVPA